MADILLKYLTDLPSASSAEFSDLLHVNQSGNDRSLTISVLLSVMIDGIYPIGSVHFFTDTTNPNVTWPGTTWARIPGAGRTLRLANNSGSDVMQQGGSDSVILSQSNIPPHKHTVNITTSLFDHGLKQTSNYTHAHSVQLRSLGSLTGGAMDGSSDDIISTQSTTTSSDTHSHYVDIGAHQHQVSGETDNFGSATEFNITNKFIKLAGWYRTA